jgi:DNA-binding response OmpR family regulator
MTAHPRSGELAWGPLVLDTETRTLRRDERLYHLTPKEAQLLAMFLAHPGQVLTRQFLMKEVWQTDYMEDMRTLEVHVHWLRQKLQGDPAQPSVIRTVRGVGYILRPHEPEERSA